MGGRKGVLERLDWCRAHQARRCSITGRRSKGGDRGKEIGSNERFADLNNWDGKRRSGWSSRAETEAAERQRTALNDIIVAYNGAVAANERDQARFNEAVDRYNLMLAHPDGLAEDRAKG